MGGRFGQLILAILFSGAVASHALAETAADTAGTWGLIGTWARDCSVPAAGKNKVAKLSYVILGDNRFVHRRDFGDDTNDENPVVGAEVSGDGMLNLRVVFPKFNNQTREYGLMRQPDGTMRTMYNHDERQEYSIKDGIFTANGNPTPELHKCR